MLAALLPGPVGAVAPVFSDDFETGDLTRWTRSKNVAVQSAQTFGGTFAARTTASSAWTFVRFADTYDELYARFWFRLNRHTTHVTLARLRAGGGPPILQIFVNRKGKLVFKNHVTGTRRVSSQLVGLKSWHDLQVHARVGESGRVDVWFDDVAVSGLGFADDLGSTPIGRFELGNRQSNRDYDLVFDNAIADVQRIDAFTAPPAPPEPPGSLPQETPDPTWMVNGKVRALLLVGDRIYLGGKFTELRELPSTATGGEVIPVRNLAAIDANTGEPVRGWTPDATGGSENVYALAHLDGQIVIGGNFRSLDGVTVKHLAAVDPITGAVDPTFAPRMGRTVWALAASGTRLYVGGAFEAVDGTAREYLAAFDTGGNLVDGWRPSTNGRVRDIALVPGGGGATFVAGHFDEVQGSGGGPWLERRSIARLTSSGEVTAAWQVDRRIGTTNWGISVWPSGDAVFLGTGGSDWVASFDLDTGDQNWRTDTNGSVQAVTVMGDHVVIGGHFKYVAPDKTINGCYEDPSRCVYRLRLAALDLAGTLEGEWDPGVKGHYNGVWQLLVDGSRLFLGGQFKRVGGLRQEYFARLSR